MSRHQTMPGIVRDEVRRELRRTRVPAGETPTNYAAPVAGLPPAQGTSNTTPDDVRVINARPAARVVKDADQTIASGSETALTWNTPAAAPNFDTAGALASDGDDHLELPEDGVYLVAGCVVWGPTADTNKHLQAAYLYHGSDRVAQAGGYLTNNDSQSYPLSAIISGSAGDEVRLKVSHGASSSIDVVAGPPQATHLSLTKMADN